MKKTTNTTLATVNTNTTLAKTTKNTKVAKIENATKTNNTIEYETLYNELINCTTKCELVNTMFKYNLYTSTTPTTTKNANDLYIQFNEKSRLLIGKKSLKVYTNNEHANNINSIDNNFQFDLVNDGSYRVKRATVQKTLENFIKIFDYYKSIDAFTIISK